MNRGKGAFGISAAFAVAAAFFAAVALLGTPAFAAHHASLCSHENSCGGDGDGGSHDDCGDCPVCSLIMAARVGAAAVDAPPLEAAPSQLRQPAAVRVSVATASHGSSPVSLHVRLND